MSETKVITTKQFWDCECKKDYVREKGENCCGVCYAHEDEMPDSHVNEVPLWMLNLAKSELTDELAIIVTELQRRSEDG